jgi:hypothetical protein
MRFVKGFVLLGLISLLAVSIHPDSGYAEQAQGAAPALASSAADAVVRTDEAGPFMLAHWRPRYRGGWYVRPYSRGYYGPSYVRGYYRLYPSVRCWWNGYRWVCPYKYKKYWL